MGFKYYAGTVKTTGENAAATGSVDITMPGSDEQSAEDGWIEWIDLNYHADCPASADVTIAYKTAPPRGTLYAKSNTATDVTVYPRAGAVDAAGSAITNSHTRFPAHTLTVSVAEANALTACLVATVCVSSR